MLLIAAMLYELSMTGLGGLNQQATTIVLCYQSTKVCCFYQSTFCSFSKVVILSAISTISSLRHVFMIELHQLELAGKISPK